MVGWSGVHPDLWIGHSRNSSGDSGGASEGSFSCSMFPSHFGLGAFCILRPKAKAFCIQHHVDVLRHCAHGCPTKFRQLSGRRNPNTYLSGPPSWSQERDHIHHHPGCCRPQNGGKTCGSGCRYLGVWSFSLHTIFCVMQSPQSGHQSPPKPTSFF